MTIEENRHMKEENQIRNGGNEKINFLIMNLRKIGNC